MVGSLATLLLVWAIGPSRWEYQLVAAVVVAALSLWSARAFADEGDPGWVVVDEAAGTLVATVGLGAVPALVAFIVFRIADATKALPGVAAAERLPGAIGITADDLVAGGYALAVGWAIQALT